MLMLLHYLPHALIAALTLLALAVMFSDDDIPKRSHLERPRRRHYVWDDHRAHRD